LSGRGQRYGNRYSKAMDASTLLYGRPPGPRPMAISSSSEAEWLAAAIDLPALTLPGGVYADALHNDQALGWRPLIALPTRTTCNGSCSIRSWFGVAPHDFVNPAAPLTWAGFSWRDNWTGHYSNRFVELIDGQWSECQAADTCQLLLQPALSTTLDEALQNCSDFASRLERAGWSRHTPINIRRHDVGRALVRILGRDI
jgi:hypothetical protein